MGVLASGYSSESAVASGHHEQKSTLFPSIHPLPRVHPRRFSSARFPPLREPPRVFLFLFRRIRSSYVSHLERTPLARIKPCSPRDHSEAIIPCREGEREKERERERGRVPRFFSATSRKFRSRRNARQGEKKKSFRGTNDRAMLYLDGYRDRIETEIRATSIGKN